MLSLQPAVISLPDPVLESEGSVDPLSLQRTYERLADAILPAVTVRMSRIRFLTAMCIGAKVCQDQRDALASDGVTPPWLVFEWFVVEAFARMRDAARGERIPGLQKVNATLRNRRAVSAATYLKTPTVFGFSGIFRRLATAAKILTDDLDLDDGGWELLRAWERDQQLAGLIDGRGPGADLMAQLQEAVGKGLTVGHTVRCPDSVWAALADHLHPSKAGKRERTVLHRRLRETHSLTAEHLDALAKHGAMVDRRGEAAYLRRLSGNGKVSAELARALAGINAYEGLCRPIVDTFDLIRELSTQRHLGPISAADFADTKPAQRLVERLRAGCQAAADYSWSIEAGKEIRTLIDRFDRVETVRALFAATIAYHEESQRNKPPDGKRSWLERARGDTYMVRFVYALAPADKPPPPYVHDYRTATLSTFLTDLRVIP